MRIQREWTLDVLSVLGGWAVLMLVAGLAAMLWSPGSQNLWLDRLSLPLFAIAVALVAWRSMALDRKIEKTIDRGICLRKPLTDEEIDMVAAREKAGRPSDFIGTGWRDFARAIELEHGIGRETMMAEQSLRIESSVRE